MNRHSLWRPRLRELPEQCRSCPFLEGNDKEFGEVLTRLRKALTPSNRAPITPSDIRFARFQIKMDLHHSGDFACHGSVYDEAMNVRPKSAHRQCPGASAFYRGGETTTDFKYRLAETLKPTQPPKKRPPIYHKRGAHWKQLDAAVKRRRKS